MSNKYTLEVSSPTWSENFEKNTTWSNQRAYLIKLGPHVEGERRYEGTLIKVNEEILTIQGKTELHETISATSRQLRQF